MPNARCSPCAVVTAVLAVLSSGLLIASTAVPFWHLEIEELKITMSTWHTCVSVLGVDKCTDTVTVFQDATSLFQAVDKHLGDKQQNTCKCTNGQCTCTTTDSCSSPYAPLTEVARYSCIGFALCLAGTFTIALFGLRALAICTGCALWFFVGPLPPTAVAVITYAPLCDFALTDVPLSSAGPAVYLAAVGTVFGMLASIAACCTSNAPRRNTADWDTMHLQREGTGSTNVNVTLTTQLAPSSPYQPMTNGVAAYPPPHPAQAQLYPSPTPAGYGPQPSAENNGIGISESPQVKTASDVS